MKRMKKVLAYILTAVVLLTTGILADLPGVAVTAKAEGGVTIKLHYNRPDGAYDGWDVWFWEYGKDGGAHAFAEEDGDMVATLEVTPGTVSVGYIVRTASWDKDVAEDQFIDIAEMVSGTVHVYVESGVKGCTKEYGEDAVVGIRVKDAVYNGDGTVKVTMTGAPDGIQLDSFTVEGAEGEIAIDLLEEQAGGVYILTLAEELNSVKSYTLTYDGNAYKIMMPSIYSTEKFEKEYTYTGNDLGATWTPEKTTFRVWAPTAEEVSLKRYRGGNPDAADLIEMLSMTPDVNGTWVTEVAGDISGTYYAYVVKFDGKVYTACDPYARTTGTNGVRAMVLDLSTTNPEGWEKDKNPHAGETINDAIIYEVHIRDLTTDANAGIEHVGKYLGVIETGTKTSGGVATALDHIKDMGVTHVQIQPFYDFGSVDETGSGPRYNWGYDPVNYNVPDGSYATNSMNGEVRVMECKQMIMGLHQNGLSVVMDVVYNHVLSGADFCFNVIVPGYFSRINENGSYSNGSGCGNDTASERSMVKKYIVDSVNYWVEEYHIDGFRFDLVGLLDVETIQEIVSTVHEKHPDVIFYGEGWTLTTTPTKENVTLATQTNSTEVPEFGFFNDTIRDGLKGSVFNTSNTGFVSGASGMEAKMERCFLGADTWCKSPAQTINYASCHDNDTLWDRLTTSCKDATEEQLIAMNKLTAAIYLTAEGVPFMLAGEEMLRTKGGNTNSYNATDEVNNMNWASLEEKKYADVYEYYKGLIAFRRAHSVLRLTTAEDVEKYVSTITGLDTHMFGIHTVGGPESEKAEEMLLYFNANTEAKAVTLPDGKWDVMVNNEKAGTKKLATVSGTIDLPAQSAFILVKHVPTKNVFSFGRWGKFATVGCIGAALALLAALLLIFTRKKKPQA